MTIFLIVCAIVFFGSAGVMATEYRLPNFWLAPNSQLIGFFVSIAVWASMGVWALILLL